MRARQLHLGVSSCEGLTILYGIGPSVGHLLSAGGPARVLCPFRISAGVRELVCKIERARVFFGLARRWNPKDSHDGGHYEVFGRVLAAARGRHKGGDNERFVNVRFGASACPPPDHRL